MYAAIFLIIPLLALLSILIVDGKNSRQIALFASLAVLAYTIYTLVFEQTGRVYLDQDWVPDLGIRFHLEMDGISTILVLLTTLLYPFIIAASLKSSILNPKSFYALMMLMQFGLLGVFMAKDAFLFYVFYELTLVPVYFICAFWGGERSIPITLKFFIYTLAGSLFMLIAILYLYFRTPAPHTFDIESFYHLQLTSTQQAWIFWAFFLAFAVKIPIFPFHTWQPDTYTVSPVAGTMLLAGIMLKMGIYGLIRFVLPIVPEGVAAWGNTAMILCIIGIVYASAIALRQNDLKRLIAYSSIAHVGLIAAGTLAGTSSGVQGAVIQMFNHGVNVVALFFIIDILERRYGTRWMQDLSGVAGQMKRFSWLVIIVLLGSVGLPLTNGFVGEFLLLNGLYNHNAWFAAVAGLTLILGAAYMLRLYRNVFLGEANSVVLRNSIEGGDVSGNENWILIPLCILVIAIGVYPNVLLNISQASVDSILQVFHQTTITAAAQ
ncbi:MAG TPA: NADH-quinone oxidoreductase subunit M [Chitinophagales bacterium]|nr:NADH-quinone oxidoreductase subunit M [Chitinophagales bacterium]